MSFQPITTKFSRFLNIKTPIVAAPMAFASTPDLAAAVTGAGGFGFIGTGFDSSAQLRENLQSVRKSLKLPADAPVPVGVGFIGWLCDIYEISEDPRIEAVLEEKPVAAWFAFGNDLYPHIQKVRNFDAKREFKTKIFVCCHTIDQAVRAANEWKADVIVVQGYDAGGHGDSSSPPLFNFIPAVKEALPNGPLILATGAIATGAQVAGMLAMGADGVVMGTRFLFTPECQYTDQMKKLLIESSWGSTERSRVPDETFEKDFFPAELDARIICTNGVMQDYKAGLSLEERIRRYKEAMAAGKDTHLMVWAGVGVAHTNEIKPAADVLTDVHNEAVEYLKRAYHLV